MKHLIIVLIIVFSLFINNVSLASSTPANQVSAIVEILETLGVEKTKINKIVIILEQESVETKYNSTTGVEVVPLPVPVVPQVPVGCEGGNNYNITNGQLCPGKKPYVAPAPIPTPRTAPHTTPLSSA